MGSGAPRSVVVSLPAPVDTVRFQEHGYRDNLRPIRVSVSYPWTASSVSVDGSVLHPWTARIPYPWTPGADSDYERFER